MYPMSAICNVIVQEPLLIINAVYNYNYYFELLYKQNIV